MSHDWQSADEIEAHFAENGPLMAARRFLTTVIAGRDLDAAWTAVDPAFRLVLAQRWTWLNRDDADVAEYELRDLASELADEHPTHELWSAFAETILDDLGSRWPWLELERLGAASRPGPVAIGYELVRLSAAAADDSLVSLNAPTSDDQTLQLLMHHDDDRWLVAGVGSDELPAPAWPPS